MMTKELLHELFEYKDGNLYWKIKVGVRSSIGKKAGSIRKDKYFQIQINKKPFLIHRLIFLYHHGYLPAYIDHIDCNRGNNKIENLRAATKINNGQNLKKRIANKSGYKNVFWKKDIKKWAVQLPIDGKKKWFGSYFDIEVARFVAETMRHKYHGKWANHG